jgi:two-component system NarL family response regulator
MERIGTDRWLALPTVPGDDQKTYNVRLIIITANILLFVLPVILLGNLLETPLRLPLILANVVEIIGTLVVRQWTYRHKETNAGLYLVVFGYFLAILMALNLATMRTLAIIIFIVFAVQVQAALVYGWKGLLFSAATVAVCIGGVLEAKAIGLLPVLNFSATVGEWMQLFQAMVVITAVSFGTRRIILQAFNKAKKEVEVRKHAEAALAVVSERERMGRDLHDGLGQVLSYIVVQSQAASILVREGQTAEADVVLRKVEQAASNAALDVRQHILGLRSKIGSYGFLDNLKALIEEIKERFPMEVNLSLPSDTSSISFSSENQEALLRIIQEALVNAGKHAQAGLATITFQLLHDSIQILITDNGKGFEVTQGVPTDHFGLKIMRERMEQMRGIFEIRSQPGNGTQVLLSLPRDTTTLIDRQLLKGLRILLADDHPLFMEGLRNLLIARGITVVGTARDGQEAVEKTFSLHPDVLIMDLNMPVMTGLEATRIVKEKHPEVKVIILTVSDDEENMYQALLAGASGFLLKNLDGEKLNVLLTELARGEAPLAPEISTRLVNILKRSMDSPELGEDLHGLSPQQLSILRLVKKGKTYKEIGVLLSLSEPTIKYHMGQIQKRLNLTNREEALRYYDDQNTRRRV